MPTARVIVLAVLLACAVAGCATVTRRARVAAPAATVTPAPRCPDALAPGPRAAAHVPRAIFSHLHRIFPDFDVRGTSIDALLPLYVDELLPSVRVTKLRAGPARRACGERIVDRSWAALVGVPRAPAASVGFTLVYVARTPRGWQPWYVWAPNYSARGVLLPTR